MTLREAIALTGGLSHPSKMPCPCWGISQAHCVTGSKQAKHPRTACSVCYAARGHYQLPTAQRAMQARLEGLKDPRWVEAMTLLISTESDGHFRWFDSGDLQSKRHLNKIIKIAKNLPNIKFWLPTQEQVIVRDVKVPRNLTVRVTAPKINAIKMPAFRNVATVVESDKASWDKMVQTNNLDRWFCPADGSGPHKCGACRACWNKDIKQIVYRKK